MPFIQNIAAMDVPMGFHWTPQKGSILIQIADNDVVNFPIPSHNFDEIYQFKFLDVEEHTEVIDPAMKISELQAAAIVEILEYALAHNMDVVVNCHAGVCRSGAVCEVGVIMGFQDTKRFRAPNLLVKKKLLTKLYGTYDETSVFVQTPTSDFL